MQLRYRTDRYYNAAHHVHNGQIHDRTETSQPAVRYNGAEDRKEIRQAGKDVKRDGRTVVVVAEIARQV